MEVLVLLFLLWVLIAAAVALHANSVGRSALLWGMVTFFLGVFGVLAYALVAASSGDDEPETSRVCPACGNRQPGSPDYCSDCGEPLDAGDDARNASVLRSGDRAYCSNCKTRVDLDADRCPDCGAAF